MFTERDTGAIFAVLTGILEDGASLAAEGQAADASLPRLRQITGDLRLSLREADRQLSQIGQILDQEAP